MSRPRRRDWRRGLRAYVLGKDRGWDPSTKTSLAAEELEAEQLEAEEAAGRVAAAESGAEVYPGGAEGVTPEEEASPAPDAPGIPQVGVPVPDRLDFHRGASTWRDRIPGLRRGGP